MQVQYASGPWTVVNRDSMTDPGWAIMDADGEMAVAFTNGNTKENLRDARLISAAPDLLAACKMTLAHMYAEELDAPTAAELERTLMDAIAKVEGREL